MIVPIDIDKFKKLTDDTREIEDGYLLLSTTQNASYRKDKDSNFETLTPQELIELWNLEDIKVVGVTGTNGKTTTTALIYSFLIDLGYSTALQGTRGLLIDDKPIEARHMTTPSILETLWNMKRAKDSGANYFIMEVSSHAIDQNRIEGIKFALKVHTNVTRDHLDYHGSVEEYRLVKSRFFSDSTLKLLNKDEIKNITFNANNAYTYGIEEPATFKIMAYSLQGGINGVLQYRDEREVFFSNMMGLFNLYNLTASISAVKLLTHRDLSEICDVVENFGGISGRMEMVSKNPMIIVDFAHTDDGIYRVLDSLKDKDLVVVFGAGGNRDRGKRPKMGAVVGRFAKKIYVTSDNPRDEVPEMIIQDILMGLKGKENVQTIVDRKEAIKRAILELENAEILLILGKGDEPYQEINGVKYPFDDREIVREILKDSKESK